MANIFDERLKPYLQPDERLLWSGSPKQGYVQNQNQGFMLVAAVLIIPALLLLDGGSGPDFVFKFQILRGFTAIIVLAMIVVSIVIDKLDRENTLYAITNERVLFLYGPFTIKQASIPLNTLNILRDVEYVDIANGFGAITFKPGMYVKLKLFPIPWFLRRGYRPSSFLSINYVQDVYHILRDAIAEAKPKHLTA
jgi:hypothetical protein